MTFHLRRLVLMGIALWAATYTASAQSDVLSWGNITYAPANAAAAATATSIGNSSFRTLSATLKITLGNSATFYTGARSPISASNADGTNIYATTGNANQRSLQVASDFTTNADFATVTITFSKPVANLTFMLFDVDSGTVAGGGYADVIRSIQGLPVGGGAAIGPSNVAAGTTNTVTGSGLTYQATGNATNAQTATGGNVMVTFSGPAITQLSFVYGDAYTIPNGGSHSAVQIVALGDMAFQSIPEPGTATALVAGTLGMAAAVFRRRRR